MRQIFSFILRPSSWIVSNDETLIRILIKKIEKPLGHRDACWRPQDLSLGISDATNAIM